MSSLIVAHDQRIMMLEFAVENLHVPQNSIFDKAILKKVTVMFRFLDEDWTELLPNRRDHHSYRGSNYENERFYGGRSIVFALPESSLEKPMNVIDLQVYVFKEICDYFELDSCENIGFTLLRVDHLINAIIKELQERKELAPYLCNSHENDPISRSLIGTYTLINDDLKETNATIKIYIRITYLGNCIITEFENIRGIKTAFHCRKDNVEGHPYQLRELTSEDLQTGCWGSQSYLPPAILKKLKCYCEQDKIEKQILAQLIEAAKAAREAEAAKAARESEAARIAKLKGLEKEEFKKKKKKRKKKKMYPDAHDLNFYNEKMQAIKEQNERKQKGSEFGGAGEAFSKTNGNKIRSPLFATSPIQICSPIVGLCSPCSNFLPCVGLQPLAQPFATYSL